MVNSGVCTAKAVALAGDGVTTVLPSKTVDAVAEFTKLPLSISACVGDQVASQTAVEPGASGAVVQVSVAGIFASATVMSSVVVTLPVLRTVNWNVITSVIAS